MVSTHDRARILAQNGEGNFGKNAGALVPSFPAGVSHSENESIGLSGVSGSSLQRDPEHSSWASRANTLGHLNE